MLQTYASWQPGRWYYQYLVGTRYLLLKGEIESSWENERIIRKSGVTVKQHGRYEWQIISSAIFELLEYIDIGQLCVLPSICR